MKFPRLVYALRHNPTKRIYVGSSADPAKRIGSHFGLLKNGKHPIAQMQKDYNDYGGDYSVFLIDEIEGMQDRGKEYLWMLKLDTKNPEHGYNAQDKGWQGGLDYIKEFPVPLHKPEQLEEAKKALERAAAKRLWRLKLYSK